jgi:23S rRNA (guanine745-N1)-methyltransferase
LVVGQEHRDESTRGSGGLDLALSALRCPVCGAGLARDAATLRCANGHAFDVARQGHVHLAPGTRRLAGDTAAMVQARAAFLAAGHYAPLCDALARQAAAVTAPGVVADVGAGTGHHLAAVLDASPDRIGVALDSSVPALRRAARAHPRMAAVACDAWHALPLRDDAAAVLLSVFAPRGAHEIARVLAPGGVVLVVTPTERHLAELREPLRMLGVDAGKADRLAASLGLHERERTLVEAQLTLTADAARQAAAMGPAGHHERDTAPLPATLTATLSVELTALSSTP